MYKLYHCCRCGETFWKTNANPSCPSCGNSKIEKKEVDLDLNNKSMTINNVVHGLKEEGVVRINIRGERRKGCFSCNSCGTVFEADCTEGLQVVACPHCNDKNFEAKSPIVSVIGGVAGLPPIKTSWTKAELKRMKFAKSCYAKSLELKNAFDRILALMKSLEIPSEFVDIQEALKEDSLEWLDKYHEKKIEEYLIED